MFLIVNIVFDVNRFFLRFIFNNYMRYVLFFIDIREGIVCKKMIIFWISRNE